MARTKKTEEAPKKVTKPRAKKASKPKATTEKINDTVIAEESIAKPAPAPSGKSYKVIAKHGLRVRIGASFDDKILRVLPYGTKITVHEAIDGWGRIGSGEWVCMDYLK